MYIYTKDKMIIVSGFSANVLIIIKQTKEKDGNNT